MSLSDSGSTRSSLRASAFLNRPLPPIGPRMRKSRSNLAETYTPLSSTLDLQEFGSPASSFQSRSTSLTPSSPSTSSFRSDRMSLAAVSEEPNASDPVPAYEEEETHSTSQDSSTRVVSIAPTLPKLVPPPGMNFESVLVPWKALPLEAALWTLDSKELQNIVSHAIQSSDAFIRLLTEENANSVLPAELERLDTLKAVTQSKYRFLVHRRTMLFQALQSTLASTKDEGALVIGRLASQLAGTIAECDKLSEELLSISDQTAQINKLIDIHLGSAFAVALRKLNGTLSRRIADLAEAKERIAQLEINVQEAWKETEKLAKELDDYEIDDTEAIIEVAEIVPIQSLSPTHSQRPSTPMSPMLLSITPPVTTPTSPMAPRSPLGSHFVFPPPVIHLKEKENEAEDVPDTVSVQSSHSTRSVKSTRSPRKAESSRTSSVQAAKRRSHRASQSSLRLGNGHSRKQSSIQTKSQQEQPPVPELPLHFADNVMLASTPYASSTLLCLDAKNPSLRRGSLDTVYTLRTAPPPAAAVAFRGRSADDMYVRPYKPSSSKTQLVPRSHEVNINRHFPPKNDAISTAPTSETIPSMWMNADAVKYPLPLSSSPPPQANAQLGRPSTKSEPNPVLTHSNSMRNTYSKLKTLTKRYSTSLPIFSTKPSQGIRTASRPRTG